MCYLGYVVQYDEMMLIFFMNTFALKLHVKRSTNATFDVFTLDLKFLVCNLMSDIFGGNMM